MKTIPAAVLALAALLSAGGASGQAVKATTAAPVSQSACCVDSSARMGQMDAHMRRMQELRAKLADAKTPEEGQKLMDDQRQEMHQGMAMMQGMSTDGSMMGGTGPGMKSHTGKPADQNMQMQMIERRLDMMQAMMQTMLDQQSAPEKSPLPAPVR